MEYQFRARKRWHIPDKALNIIYLGVIINYFFPKTINSPWLNIFLILLGIFLLGVFFRELSSKLVLTVSDQGFSYSGNQYLFADKINDIPVEKLSKIFIANNKPKNFREKWFLPKICLIDEQGKLFKDLNKNQWVSFSDVTLDCALLMCFEDKVELIDHNEISNLMKSHQRDINQVMNLGKEAGYFSYTALLFAFIYADLAFIDSNLTLSWGNYLPVVWGVAIVIAIICFIILLRAKTHTVALLLVPILFTALITLFIHQSFMVLNYHLGTEEKYIFEKVIQNKESEVWKAKTGEEINCIASPRALRTQKPATVRKGIFGIVRTQFKEICLNPEQIKKLSGKKV